MRRRSFFRTVGACLLAPIAMVTGAKAAPLDVPPFPGPDDPMIPWKNYTAQYTPQDCDEVIERIKEHHKAMTQDLASKFEEQLWG